MTPYQLQQQIMKRREEISRQVKEDDLIESAMLDLAKEFQMLIEFMENYSVLLQQRIQK